jgi:hypothetical protein
VLALCDPAKYAMPPLMLVKAEKKEDQDQVDAENEHRKALHKSAERMKDMEMSESIKTRNKVLAQIEEEHFKVFAHIWKNLSVQSRELVKLEDSKIYEK